MLTTDSMRQCLEYYAFFYTLNHSLTLSLQFIWYTHKRNNEQCGTFTNLLLCVMWSSGIWIHRIRTKRGREREIWCVQLAKCTVQIAANCIKCSQTPFLFFNIIKRKQKQNRDKLNTASFYLSIWDESNV